MDLDELDIYGLYELLNHNREEVLELMEAEKKSVKSVVDPLALVVEKRLKYSFRASMYDLGSNESLNGGEHG